ncbi:flagellar basal body P-ring formation chaperone FlgA [uncultured Kushneria sp.]|uniref:flagellar basal body P-ring formation chaperone FlgA n=1 Tax=uncultured Kushneria sp. TaxID=905033 RepID=UPI0026064339|nr:flagellar basal body P-ring formation chaperone FlgA [uncultured Kushneria sp.]
MSLPFIRSYRRHCRHGATLLLVAAGLICVPVEANEQVIYDVIEGFLLEQTAGENGDITIEITPSPAAAMACQAPSAFLPGRGGKVSGRTSVGVRCPGNAPETRYFQAYVHINGQYPVVNRNIMPGDVIEESDLDWQEGDLTRLSSRLITDASQLVGQVSQRRIAAGQPLQTGMVKAPVLIQRGAEVALLVRGNGFMISSSGQALNDAGLGESVRVRMPSGSVINGEASREGVVEVH